ncbi:MAG: isocitrate lyase/PEP mutase family protein [Polymorphobacter sp.]|uniref:isocitrate lyase/PEP mutase family protein n=1 Tax=Polymorphobacter sp. TaxID=1909290 RepID=UPI003A8817FF
MNPASTLRQALAEKQFFVAPGMHDMITAKLAARIGFRFGYGSGYWLVASAFGLPDAGIATYSQMVERVGTLVEVTSPMAIIADADTGYGGLLNVRQTMRGYEKAGVAAIQLEDQEFPKRCGHTKGKRLVSTEEMVARITVACESRSGPDGPVIIARSDAKQSEGTDAMLRRLEAYAKAGAEMLFPEALADEEEMAYVAARLPAPALANMADGGSTRILPAARLAEIGYGGAIFPAMTALASAAASERALTRLKETGTSLHGDVPLYSFDEFCQLIGFDDVYAFDARFAHVYGKNA